MGHRAAKVQFPFARRRYTYEAEARVVYVTLLGWACVLVTKSLSNLPDVDLSLVELKDELRKRNAKLSGRKAVKLSVSVILFLFLFTVIFW